MGGERERKKWTMGFQPCCRNMKEDVATTAWKDHVRFRRGGDIGAWSQMSEGTNEWEDGYIV